MANRRGKSGSSDRFFLGPKITENSDCSHEIKRCLLPGRKAMTNLDSILKSRDITLPTKVPIVKALVSPIALAIWKLNIHFLGAESDEQSGLG